ncbi:MAG: DUF92 domain-containing protein [Candidatus Micrarchaeaceae archaeon]
MNFLTLDKKGLYLALLFGALLLIFGRSEGIFFLTQLFLFLLLSAIVTRLGKGEKEYLKIYERSRGIKNVISNGILPVAIAILHYFQPSTLLLVAYSGSVAAITADKFASEVGVLDPNPRDILTMRKVKPGTSGGISALGTFSSLLGSMLISITFLYISDSFKAFAIVAVSGFFGSIVDSLVGHSEEKGKGNKYLTNFFCSLAGAIVAALLFLY